MNSKLHFPSTVMLAVAALVTACSAPIGHADELVIKAGQTVTVHNGQQVLTVIVGPKTVKSLGKIGKWIRVELADGRKGFVAANENPKGKNEGSREKQNKQGTDSQKIRQMTPSGSTKAPAPVDSEATSSYSQVSPVPDTRAEGPNQESTIAPAPAPTENEFTQLLSSRKGFPFQKPAGLRTSPEVLSIAFSEDGTQLFVGERNVDPGPAISISNTDVQSPHHDYAVCRILDLSSGEEWLRLVGHDGATHLASIAVTTDPRLVCTTGVTYASLDMSLALGIPANDRQQAILWDLPSGEKLFEIPKHARQVSLSPTGDRLVTLGKRTGTEYLNDGTLSVYDLSNLQQVKQLPLRWTARQKLDQNVKPVFSRSGKSIFARCFSARDRRPAIVRFRSATGELASIYSDGEAFVLSSDDKFLAVSDGRSITVWDLLKTAQVRRFDFQQGKLLAFSNDSKQLIAINERGSMMRWDLQSGNQLASLNGFARPKAFSPSKQVVACVRDDSAVDLIDVQTGQAFLRYTPMHGERQFRVQAISGAINQGAATNNNGNGNSTDRPLVDLSRRSTKPSAIVNKADKKSVADILSMAKFARETVTAKPATETSDRGRLFVLSVGVSNYKYKEYRLQFAGRDAEQTAKFFTDQDKKLYEVIVQEYVDQDATSENLNRGLRWIRDSCREGDIAVILFSGHGIQGRNGLYFMPFEGDAQGIQYTCVNWTEVAKTIEQIKADNILLLNDCCHAGDFGTAKRATQTDLMKSIGAKKGFFMYCSSLGDQLSLERPEQKHGLFTYAILEALRGKAEADLNQDGQISIRELKESVDKQVHALSKGRQTPVVANENVINWDLPISTLK